jgi:hypothetical protein
VRASLIVIAAAFLFIGGIFVAIAGSTLLEEWRYELRGVRAEAVATGKALHRATDTSSTAYEISYRFQLSDGSSHARVEGVPVQVWEAVVVNSPLAIEYLAGEPASSRVVESSAHRESVTRWLLIGSVLVLGGLIALKRSFRREPVDTQSTPPPLEPAVAQEPSFWPLARRSSSLWFGAIFLSVGLAFLIGGSVQLYHDVMFARESVVTRGIVLTKEIKRSGKQNRTRRYEATYRYAVVGNTFEGRDALPVDRWKQLVEREPVDVLYDRRDSAVSRLAGRRSWLVTALIALVGALLTAIGGRFLIGAIRRARLEWRLRQSGVPAPGTVMELRDLNLKINDVRQWRLHYQYRDLRGHIHDQTIDVPEDEAQQWTVGQAGKVLYDSARPNDAIWVGRT